MPTGIRHRIWRHRALLTCPELTAASLVRLRREIVAVVAERKLRSLRRLHEGGLQDLVELCDYERKLEIAVMNTMLAGLHNRPRMRILDIGCGGGYFVAACRHLGHACEGTEVPANRLSPTVAAAYRDVSTALRIAPMIELCIERHRPIEVLAPATYDMITAHKICFNGHMRPNPWSAAEWKFFIDDVRRFLVPGGQLVLDLNEDVARYGSRRWYDGATAEYFASVGQLVRNRVVVTNPAP